MINGLILSSAILFAGVLALFSYGAFWAISIRKAQVIRVYRNQALGTAIVALSFALLTLVAAVTSFAANSTSAGPVDYALAYVLILAILYFMDSSVLASKRVDRLQRYPLAWNRLRIPIWATAIVLVLIVWVEAVPFNPNPTTLVAIIASLPGLLAFGIGSLALAVGVSRTRDPLLRRHLFWFAVFVGLVFLFFIILSSTPNFSFSGENLNYFELAGYYFQFITVLGAGYCLYRTAKALVPLNRFSLEERAPLQ